MNLFSSQIQFSDLFCCGRLVDFRSRSVETQLKTASARISTREIIVPLDCSLLQAFSSIENDMKLVIKSGEYEWDGQITVERSGIRIEGEDGTRLAGALLLKAGSSGSICNLEVSLFRSQFQLEKPIRVEQHCPTAFQLVIGPPCHPNQHRTRLP